MTLLRCVAALALLTSLSKAAECPNPKFELIAQHRQQFNLKDSVDRQIKQLGLEDSAQEKAKDTMLFWLAFGSKDLGWVVTLISPMYKDGDAGDWNQFKCKENYWGSVKPNQDLAFYKDQKRVQLKPHVPPICCVSPLTIDQYEKGKTTNPFAVLPVEYHNQLTDMSVPNRGAAKIASKRAWYFFNFQDEAKQSIQAKTMPNWKTGDHQFWRGRIMRMPDQVLQEEKMKARVLLSKQEWKRPKEILRVGCISMPVFLSDVTVVTIS